MAKVVYLCGDLAPGRRAFYDVVASACEVVGFDLHGRKVTDFPAGYDLGVGFLYPHKIPEKEVAGGRRWVNLHPAPLPEYRGRNVFYHAILNGDGEFGATIHYMDKDYDTGDVIEVSGFPIPDTCTAEDLMYRSWEECTYLLKKWLPRLLKGSVPAAPQDHSRARYYRKEPINEEIRLHRNQAQLVRALYAGGRKIPHVVVGGKKFYLVPEERVKD